MFHQICDRTIRAAQIKNKRKAYIVDIRYNVLMIETEQKIIQIGSSDGVTLSKKDLAKLEQLGFSYYR